MTEQERKECSAKWLEHRLEVYGNLLAPTSIGGIIQSLEELGCHKASAALSEAVELLSIEMRNEAADLEKLRKGNAA